MIMHPGLIYFVGAVLLLLWEITQRKGVRIRKFIVFFIPLLALIQTIVLKPPTAWLTRLFDLPLIFFYVDKMSLFMGYIFVLIGFLAIIYAFKIEDNLFFIFSFLYIGSSLGVLFAGDYLTFFIFWEIMALAPTFLIWQGARTPLLSSRPLRAGYLGGEEALKAGYRYLIFHLIGGLFLLAGIIIEFTYRPFLPGDPATFLVTTPTTNLSSILILIGIGVNAAFILLHTWLPDAYPKAPFTASVLMSVYTTKTAVYALARLFPGVNLVAYLGTLMAIYGVTFALMQNNMRKLLSYHIISQVGYMVASIGLGGDLGVNGGLAHALHHILYKGLLFMCAGAVIYRLGEERLANLGDLFKKMPITTFTALVASFSIAGLPLFNGFISKTIISETAHQTHNYTVYLILKLASVGTWLSFLKFTYFGFLRKETGDKLPHYSSVGAGPQLPIKEVPWNMQISMLTVAFLCFLTGLYPKLVMSILPYPMGGDYLSGLHFYSGHNLLSAAQIYLITLFIFWLSKEYFAPHEIETLDFDYFYKSAYGGFIWSCKTIFTKFDTLYTQSVEKVLPYARESWGISIEEGSVEKIIKNGGGLIVQTSERISSFDQDIIDGTVNRIVSFIVDIGKKLRKIQSGYLQNYASIIFLALLLLILFLLIL